MATRYSDEFRRDAVRIAIFPSRGVGRGNDGMYFFGAGGGI
jgi:hypothetical protein